MARTIKLMYVDGLGTSNNNKFYNMIDNDTSDFTIEYGRVGVTKTTDTKPISKWNSVYKEKVRKGYKDITELYIEEVGNNVDFADISDLQVKLLVSKLQAYANKQVKANYNISAEKVTIKQVEEAQSILDLLLTCKDKDCANKALLNLYMVIPRQMSNVKNHLIDIFTDDILNKIIAKEQDLLDNMAGQVKQAILVKENMDSSINILDAMGLTVKNIQSDEVDMVKSKLQECSDRYLNAFKVENKKTQVKFDNYLVKATNKKTELFWHGSRNENWISILETGLVLRPTNAVISGKMFGYGTYFADKARKSLGYTSSRGSYWAHGSSDEAYMALFNVHVGNQYVIESSDSSLDRNKLLAKGNYDSTFAKAGKSLINNEFIVYEEDQSTVSYIVQLKG